MIVAHAGGHWLVITQTDHAHFASEVLALWRADGLPGHPRRRQLLFAAREHDNGWAEADSAPICLPASGRPADFMAVSREVRQEIWRRGTRRHVAREPYAALLILRHAMHLHRDQAGEPEWADLFAEWRELEAELAAASGVDPEAVARDYRWIELTDLLSLAACNRWTREVEAHGWSASLATAPDAEVLSGNVLRLDPFPLAGATTFRVGCRLIPDRRYAGDADLGTELALARWGHYLVRVAPAYNRPERAGI